MRSTNHFPSAARALKCVYASSIEASTVKTPLRHSVSALPPRFLRPQCLTYQLRTYNSKSARPVLDRFPRDEEIQGPYVHLVNSNGGLDPARPLRTVLQSIDRNQDFLVQVAPAEANKSAICKVVSKKVATYAERAKRKTAKNSETVVKELVMNWAIDPHDLGHRLDKMQQLLGKGFRMQIFLSGKRRGRKATFEEAEKVLNSIKERARTMNATEWKTMEGYPLSNTKLFLEVKQKS